jgi:RimJ/RimL family protein N-acetyltransferase
MQQPDPPGVTVTTLADLGDTDANRHRIWQLHEESFADEPARGGAAQRSYEHFTRQLFDTGWWQPQTQFVALADGQWAGVAVLRPIPQTNSFYTFYTGVDRAHRGRGVATALKRATIRYALGAGAAYLSTSNDSANAPMLAVNRRFGFRPLPGVLVVARAVG